MFSYDGVCIESFQNFVWIALSALAVFTVQFCLKPTCLGHFVAIDRKHQASLYSWDALVSVPQ